MLKAMFGDQQSESMVDYIQTAIMLRANKRPVRERESYLVRVRTESEA